METTQFYGAFTAESFCGACGRKLNTGFACVSCGHGLEEANARIKSLQNRLAHIESQILYRDESMPEDAVAWLKIPGYGKGHPAWIRNGREELPDTSHRTPLPPMSELDPDGHLYELAKLRETFDMLSRLFLRVRKERDQLRALTEREGGVPDVMQLQPDLVRLQNDEISTGKMRDIIREWLAAAQQPDQSVHTPHWICALPECMERVRDESPHTDPWVLGATTMIRAVRRAIAAATRAGEQ